MKSNSSGPNPWKTLLTLAQPLRGRALVVILLAALSTGATLVEPLIYRVAVNDIAGLFVGKAQAESTLEGEVEPSTNRAAPQPSANPTPQLELHREQHRTRNHERTGIGR